MLVLVLEPWEWLLSLPIWALVGTLAGLHKMYGGIVIAVGQREVVAKGRGVCDAHGSGGWESCGASRSSPVIVWGVVVLR